VNHTLHLHHWRIAYFHYCQNPFFFKKKRDKLKGKDVKERQRYGERERERCIYICSEIFACLLIDLPHRLDQAHLRRGEKLQNKACRNIKEESEKSSGR
jgi:hypothetical protein